MRFMVWIPRSRIALLLVFLALWVGPMPASAGDPQASLIDAAVKLDLPPHPHSGLSVAIVHHGVVTYEKGFGWRDDGTPDRFISDDRNYYAMPVARPPARRAPADGHTIFSIGSVTKQFTAAAVLRLVEQHRLALDDSVSRFAPEFHDPALTIRFLLAQRSGLPDLNTLTFVTRVLPQATRHDGTIDSLLVSREIAKVPVHFAAGTQFEYSNSNYFVLGTIVERIVHQPLGAYLATMIFTPVGMTRTAYAKAAAGTNVAVGYRVDAHGTVWRAYPWNVDWLGGAGAMTSTVDDLARWNIALMAHKVIGPASLGQMWRGLDAGRGEGSYAMGWIADSLGSHRYVWNNGEVGGYHALNVIFPDDDLAFTLLSNNQDAKPEVLIPQLGALYFPVGGLDRILPHSAVVWIEASFAVGLGALAIGIVAIVTFKRFLVVGVVAALLAFVVGFLLPSLIGFVWGGLIALVPPAIYVALVRWRPAAAQTKR